LTSPLPKYDVGLVSFRWDYGGNKAYVEVMNAQTNELIAKEKLMIAQNPFTGYPSLEVQLVCIIILIVHSEYLAFEKW
jgi:hypothetical protein